MFKKLREKIESKRKSKNLFWKIFVMGKDLASRCYNFFKNFHKILLYPYTKIRLSIMRKNYLENDESVISSLIRGQRILIVGSGPSASELQNIPDNVKILSCNAGPKLFTYERLGRGIDLFICMKSKLKRRKEIEDCIKKNKINIFLTDYKKFMEKYKDRYSRLIFDNSIGNYFLKTLIAPVKVRKIRGESLRPCTSTGMRLLEYSLYYKAKEIYLIGFDLGESGHFWGGKFLWLHKDIDDNFIKLMSKKYNNIYSISKKSPITKYIPYKELK